MLIALGQGFSIPRLNRNSLLRDIPPDLVGRIAELVTGDARIPK